MATLHPRCIKSELVESRNGFTINREEDRLFDPFTFEFHGRIRVWYTVNTEDDMLDSFKTLKEARRYIDNVLRS